jgi:3-dehydroquinate dehydratase-2
MATILLLNGPNLNMLGQREPDIYGATTLAELDALAKSEAAKLGHMLQSRQSNHEGELVTWIQDATTEADGLIINAGAYTHTSVALHDALRLFPGPSIELHLSNTHARESFRHHSTLSPVVTGIIQGFGADGYRLAVQAMAGLLA